MIHILCADLSSADKGVYDSLYDRASPERKARADRCRRQEDRLRCVTADALLKTVLGTEVFQIEKNACGKPYIADKEGFFFNLSHSGRYVAMAWGGSEVGVDVQKHESSVDTDAIAKRFFTLEEQTYVRGNILRFYEVWTKKESYLKYIGTGLQKNPGSFSTLTPESGIRYAHCYLEGEYSLCLCTTEHEETVHMLDVRQLL